MLRGILLLVLSALFFIACFFGLSYVPKNVTATGLMSSVEVSFTNILNDQYDILVRNTGYGQVENPLNRGPYIGQVAQRFYSDYGWLFITYLVFVAGMFFVMRGRFSDRTVNTAG
jgi:hypothetical protein